jgi:hypothetical protein
MLLERTPVLVNCSLCRNTELVQKQRCLVLRLLSRRRFGDLDGTNHQNIRNFMKTGWDGIAFYEALELKKII